MSEQKKFDDNMTGIIGKNDYKQQEKHPDKRGRCKINGVWFWISGWTRRSAQGAEFDSLAFTEMTLDEARKYEERSAQRNQPQQGGGNWQQGSNQQPQGNFQPQNADNSQPPANHPANVQNGTPPQDFDDDIPF